mgnify:CR=1 FL=1
MIKSASRISGCRSVGRFDRRGRCGLEDQGPGLAPAGGAARATGAKYCAAPAIDPGRRRDSASAARPGDPFGDPLSVSEQGVSEAFPGGLFAVWFGGRLARRGGPLQQVVVLRVARSDLQHVGHARHLGDVDRRGRVAGGAGEHETRPEHQELDHEDGELTATQKVKRSEIEKRFGDLIEEMYR